MTLQQRIGRVIRKRRRALHLKQASLAEQMGIHPGNFSRLERGRVNFTIRTFDRLCTALNTKPSKVLKEAEDWPD